MVTGLASSPPPCPDHTAIQGPGGIWIPAVPEDLVVGEIGAIARDRNTVSIPIPGYWIHKDEKLAFESPPFPTAFLDGLAGYLYLTGLGFSEEDIILVGDSAGGNLALALTRYLLSNRVEQPKLPKIPGALILHSPWTDVSEQFIDNPDPQSSQALNVDRDWLAPTNSGFPRACAEAFLGGRPEHVELAYWNPYISPASPVFLGLTSDSPTRTISFKGFPRTFIDNGGFETLCDQTHRLGDAMVEDLGEEMVVYNEVDGATHDYMTVD